MTLQAEKTTIHPDTAYKAWLGHTMNCSACRTTTTCATAARLGRTWRETRQ
ncbi:hypothetical protein OG413_29315 [Streptomyces sp. NBC_01433]|uniref:hypothetical protein n=1 Tax=Streptomyces sp. NBC_01433 TaxID=2903864 RepID=UPI002255567E|nr:hypothetical protein [Streptomyces sp. NBC_01433]MCX4679341.1 hypothetical protein [Streptomyces sp. NBC_01433]